MNPVPTANEIPLNRQPVGERMEVKNWGAFRSMLGQFDPLIGVIEALKNGFEAYDKDGKNGERPMIDIFPNSQGMVVIRDNGRGVLFNLIQERVGSFGISDKEVGAEAGQNLGWGGSTMLSFLNPKHGALFTTWTAGAKQAGQCLLGIDGEGFPALLKFGTKPAIVHQVAKPVNTSSGTQVVIGDLKFDADLLAFEISDRFPRFQTKPGIPEAVIRIHQSDPAVPGYSGTPIIVKPVAQKAMERRDHTVGTTLGIPNHGKFETANASVEWFILGVNTKEVAPCYEIWNGEVIYATSGGAAINKLSAFGVWAGHDRIVLLVTRKNTASEPKLVCNLFRTEVENWKRAKAQEQCRHIICDPEHPLWKYMKWVSEREEENADDSGVRRLLDAWGTPRSKLEGGEEDRDVSPGEGTEGTTDTPPPLPGGDGSETADPEKRRRKRQRRTATDENGHGAKLGMPRSILCSKKTLGNDAVRYIPGRNAILINKDVGITRDLLDEGAQLRKKQGTIDRIKSHMIYAVLAFNDATGRYPGQEGDEFSLTMAIGAPTAAIEYVRGSTPKKESTKKKPRK